MKMRSSFRECCASVLLNLSRFDVSALESQLAGLRPRYASASVDYSNATISNHTSRDAFLHARNFLTALVTTRKRLSSRRRYVVVFFTIHLLRQKMALIPASST
jgi:hypothetical protein